jgi:hypothetical protein
VRSESLGNSHAVSLKCSLTPMRFANYASFWEIPREGIATYSHLSTSNRFLWLKTQRVLSFLLFPRALPFSLGFHSILQWFLSHTPRVSFRHHLLQHLHQLIKDRELKNMEFSRATKAAAWTIHELKEHTFHQYFKGFPWVFLWLPSWRSYPR